MGIWRSLYTPRATHDHLSRRQRSPLSALRAKRGLTLEPMEERMLMAIGAGPDLEEILPNDGAPLAAGDVRSVSPRELKLQFDATQIIDPASLGAIQVFRSGGDGVFAPALTSALVTTPSSATQFSGSTTLSIVDDFYNGTQLTFTSGALSGQTGTVIDYVGVTRTFTVATPFTATPTAGDAFQVDLNRVADVPITPAFVGLGDRSSQVVLRFADRLPDDFYRVHIIGAGGAPLVNTAGQAFNGGNNLDVDFRLDLGTQVASIVPQPVFRFGGALTYANPDGGNGLNQIEVYFNQDALTAGAGAGGVENPAYYQLMFTGATATTGDDVVLNPASVRYFPARAMALLEFNPGDLNILDAASTVGTYRLRIGNDTAPLPPPAATIVPGVDPGSSFGTAHNLGVLGSAAQVIAGQTDVQAYGLTLPGSDEDPGHRQIPGLSHLGQGADATDGLTTIYYDFRSDYGVDPTGAKLTNQIQFSPAQRQRVREAFDIYSRYLGVQFIETTPAPDVPSVPGSITVATGVLSAVDPALTSGVGGVTGVAGVPNQPVIAGNPVPVFSSRLVVMDSADFATAASNEFGNTYLQGVMRQIGVLLGFGSASDLPDLTINAPNPSLFGNTGERIFPGDADILHGQHLYRPESNDIDLYRFSVAAGQHGVFTAETFAERLANSSSLDTVLSFYGDVTVLRTPAGIALDDGQHFTISDGITPPVTFEFNSLASVTAGRRAVNFLATDTAEQIAQKVAEAIRDTSGLDVDPIVEGDQIRLLGASSVNTLNAPFVSQSVSLELLARNDDYYSEDSNLELRLRPGVYYVGVTSTGNTQFDPNLENSGYGGTTQGNYELRLQFRPDPANNLIDASGVVLDGDGDGVPGGEFNFWFQASTLTNTIYVDKAASNIGQLGTLGNPFNNIPAAVSAAQASPGKDIIRIVANGGHPITGDGDVTTIGDNLAYEIGFNASAGALSDGTTLAIPKDTTVMIDPGVIIKLRQANIDIGSISTSVAADRSQAHLQVLGAPGRDVYFTSYHNEAVGADLNPSTTNPVSGDWGGLVFRNDIDQIAGRVVLENAGVFLNYVNHANISFGGGEITIGGQPTRFNPIDLSAARPTITNNTISASAAAAVAAGPNSFADTKFQGPTFTNDYERVGPEIHGNRLSGNTFNGLFINTQGSPERTLDVAARFDDTDIVHILTSNLVVRGNAGGPLDPDGPGAATAQARLDARLSIDPGVIMKLRGARIETQFGAQLVAEGTTENPVLFIGLSDDRYGAGGTFDTNNNGAATSAAAGEWGGLYFGYLAHGSIDHARITHGGGETTIEGGFANFNAVEIHRADVRIANSTLESNANGLATNDRNGRGTNFASTIMVRGAQPQIINNIFRGNLASVLNIDVNSMHDQIHPDAGRSTGPISRFDELADNYGPLIRFNRVGNNSLNAIEIRGGTLTTGGVWDDTDIVHVVRTEISTSNLHTGSGVRLQSSAEESLVVKLEGIDAGFTATGRPLDIGDRVGGALHLVGTPGHPVVLTALGDQTVGAGLTPEGLPQTDTLNVGVQTSNPQVPVGNSGAVIIDGGDRDDHGFALAGPDNILGTVDDINRDGWLFIEQMLDFALAGARNGAPVSILSLTAPPGAPFTTSATQAIISTARAAGAPVTFATGATIDTIDFNQFQVLYVPSDSLNVFGGISNVDLARLAARRTDIQNFVNNGGSLVALTEADAAQPYSWLELPLPFSIAASFSTRPLRKTPAAIAAGFTITDTELSNGVPYHNSFIGPPGFNGLVPFVFDTGFDNVVGNADDQIITLGLASGSFGIGTPQPSLAGDWRSVQVQQFSNDRNGVTSVEREAISNTASSINNTTSSASFLGELAPDQLSGDDNRRLSFSVHGYINSGDVDVYSFVGRAGTEVWFDIDRTTPGLDTVLELTDINGNVLARSNDSPSGRPTSDIYDANGFITNAGPGNAGRRMERGSFSGPDLYTTNLRDSGMRVVLPFLSGATDRYFVRVRSNSPDLSILDNGRTTGSYDLQIRLREEDEFPGTTVQYSDIRNATNGIEILGIPKHSPLVGDTGESPLEVNETLAAALNVGNLLGSDRGALSIAGNLAASGDVDWYSFTLNEDLVNAVPGDRTWATLFDIDYADGLSRPDTVISVFDSTGRLIYTGRDSDVVDDRSGTGGTASALDGGSYGTLDAFLGTVQLPAGQVGGASRSYFVAVHSNGTLPTALNATFTAAPGAANELVRLEPIGSVRRVVEDHIGFTGYTSGQTTTATQPISPQSPAILDISSSLSLQTHVRGFDLSDVTLFVSTGTQLSTVDGSTGAVETTVGTLGTAANPYDDIVFRSDGQLFGYQSLALTANTAGRLQRVDAGNAVQTLIGNDNVANVTLNTDRVDALAYNRTGAATYDLYYSVRNGGASSRLFRGNPANGSAATAGVFGPIGELRNEDPFGATIGVVSGMAFGAGSLAGQLFGVSDQGHLLSIDLTNGAARILTSLAGVQLQGLSLGPQNLDFNGDGIGGDLANTFFAIDGNGRLYALEITVGAGGAQAAAPRAVFDADNDGIFELAADTGLAGVTGLAFSPLDFNLWHPTFRSSADPGHGVNAAPDNSRFDSQNVPRTVNGRPQSEQVGGASFYFGLEQFVADPVAAGRYLTYAPGDVGAAVNAQYGVLSSEAQQDLTTVAGVADTYNLPGGAYGSLLTDGFSLEGYSATDKPTLYFNYYLRTEGASSNTNLMRDSARVFVSADNGVTWTMVATNNSVRAATGELPSFFSASSNVDSTPTRDPRQVVQELFDSDATREWRQARIDLGEFAGQSNLRLRFDFSTAGSMNEAGLPGDQFGNFNSNTRGQANSNEGFYVDDIVVGFAERGEMVTSAAVNSAFTTLPVNPNAAAPQPTLTGQYQLEIRRGTEFGESVSNASSAIIIDPASVRDTNDRFTQDFSLVLPAGSAITDGSTVTISDGQTTVVFEFNSDAFFSNTPVAFNAGMTAAQVVAALRDAINNHPTLNVTARANATGDRLDLVGAADATLSGIQKDVIVTLSATTVSETAGIAALLGTVTRTGSLVGDLSVTLTSSDASEAQVPITVVIANGQASANFLLDAIDDAVADGVQALTITGAAAGYNSVTAAVDVTDNETPLLSVTIAAPGSISENSGPGAIVGTVTRNTPTLTDLIVQLFSFDTSEAIVPSVVTILAGQTFANFVIDAVDDLIIDGLQTVAIAALASGIGSGTATLNVSDDGADTIAANTPLWTAEGPAPNTLGQVEGIPDGNQVSGAIHTVLAHPTDPNLLYAGSVNGGIWRTTDATAASGPTWIPLTDNLPSLSIGAMEFDITDPTSQTLIAGIGRFSSFGRTGSQLTGLLRSTDGGDTWAQISPPILNSQNMSGVAARGNILMAAANNFAGPGGLFRSTDGGASFVAVSGSNGLPSGAVADLVADPGNPSRFYAAVLGLGIFRTEDTGATWTDVTPLGVFNPLVNNNIEMAVHANPGAGTNAVYVGVMNNGQLANLLRSPNQGATWTALALPTTNEGGTNVGLQPSVKPGAQGAIHFSIVADPLISTRVYVGGDRQPNNAGFPNSLGARDFSGRLFRVDVGQAPVSLTHIGTASNSAPHADSREMVFNALGQIVETDDGGIYVRTSPGTNTGDWYSLNGNIQVTEFHDIAYDANTNTLIGGAQDTGTPEQVTPDGLRWRSVSTADGGDVTVDDSAAGQSIRYSSFQFLQAFRRRTFDAAGALLSEVFPALIVNGTGGQPLSAVDARQFKTPVELNAINPARLVIAGANAVYESFDRGETLTNLGNGGAAPAMAYGGQRLGVPNPDVLWVGASGNVLLRSTPGGSLVATPGYPAAGGGIVNDLAIDPDDWMTAYVIDASNQVFVTSNGGATYANITGNLSALTGNYLAIQVIPGAASDRIVVGTRDGLYQMLSSTPGVWTEYGSLLPNVLIDDIDYDSRDGILVVGTQGRGAFSTTSLGEAGDLSAQVLASATVAENAANPARTLRITRTSTQGDLPIVLSSSNTGKVTVAATATILNGQTFVDVPLNVVDNLIADGTQTAILSASAVGFGSTAALLDVTDNEVAGLTVTLSTANVSEDAGTNAATVTVTRNSATTDPLVVTLVSNDTSEIQVVGSVTIPAGHTSVTVPLNAIDDFAADGTKTVRITASALGHASGAATIDVLDGTNVLRSDLLGDDNIVRPQGHLVVLGNYVTTSLNAGIVVDNARGPLNSQPHPGVARNLPVLNNGRLAPGVTLENNVVAFNGDVGIRLSGDTTPAGQPNGVVPFVRVVNNTIYGASTPNGIGIEVTETISPTILNNIVANLDQGVVIDPLSQALTVMGGMLYQRAPTTLADTGAANAGLGSFPISLADTALLFRNAAVGDFELVQGSVAIDSSINSVPERPELAAIYAALGIAPSDVLAPEIDITGRLRGDNPFVNSPPAQGANVFKDRGAIERLDPVRVSVSDLRVSEGNVTAEDVVAIQLSEPVDFQLTVNYAMSAGSATAGADYVSQSGTLTFAAGVTLQLVTVSILADLLDEFDETFFVNLSNLSLGAVIDDSQGTVTILDDEPLAQVFINDVTQAEGDGGTTNFVFTVNLPSPSGKEVRVQFDTRDGTATVLDGDFNTTSGVLTFAPGQTTHLVTVQVNGNPFVEPDENFFVDLSNPVNATIGRVSGAGTIVDDEPIISITPVTVTEGSIGSTQAVFTVLLNKVSLTNVAVSYATAERVPVSASSGTDFTAASGVLNFNAGETSRTITVQVAADTVAEPTELFDLTLTSPINGKFSANNLVAQLTTSGTILDDEPRISISDVTVTPEGNALTKDAVFNVVLDRASAVQVTVVYATADGTAVSGAPRPDFTATTGTLTFTAGQTSRTVTVRVNGDTLNESNETFTVNLSGETNSAITDASGLGTIVDDDAQPFVTIENVAQNEGNSGTSNFVFDVQLTAESGQPISLNFTTTPGTATSGGDYSPTSGLITFSPGQTVQSITVTVAGDTTGEPDETFFVDLSSPVNVQVAGPLPLRGIGTILDDEPRISIGDVTVLEGGQAVFAVTLSHVGAADVSVAFATAEQIPVSAASGADFTATSGTLLFTFMGGETSRNITVQTANDALDEVDETFQVVLSSASAGVIADGTGIGTITDNDAAPSVSILDASVNEGQSGTTNMVFQVALSAASGQQITAAFSTSDGTALSGSDYSTTSGTVTFAPGEVTRTITVQVQGDTVGETNETFFVALNNAVNASLADLEAVGTIIDDEPRVFVDDASVLENSTDRNAVFVVRLDRTSSVNVVVNYATADNTAISPTDYTAVPNGTITFAPNETVQLVTVVVRGDNLDEDDETFLLNITGVANANIGDGQATGQILDEDPLPQLAILDPAPVAEGNVGTSNAVFTVTLTPTSGRPVVVLFNTVDNTATAVLDYSPTSGTLTFQPGQSTQRITVQVVGDTLGEPNETFRVNLTSIPGPGGTNANYTDAQGQATITDDEPRLAMGNAAVTETDSGTTNLLIPVNLTGSFSGSVSVSFATADNTAQAGIDYLAVNGSLVFVPGESQKIITVPVIGDVIDEINETFFVDLAGPSNNAVIAVSRGTATITDNDPFSLISIGDASLQEGDAGNTNMVFTVTISPTSGRPVTVGYFTTPGSATAGTDFVATSGTLSFAPGTTVQQISVPVIGEQVPEFDETFLVSLTTPSNGTIDDGQATGFILDDDARLTIGDVTFNPEGNNSLINALFNVTLTTSPVTTITVRYDTAAGTATAGGIDYFTASGTLTFNPGQTVQQVSVPIVGDLLDEADETFFVNLSQAVNSVILDTQAVATIVDDDLQPILSINSVSLVEGDIGNTNALFAVTLSAVSGRDVSVAFASAGGTATSGVDFQPASGTLTFSAALNETIKFITVPVVGDLNVELDETYTVNLANAVNASIGVGTGTGTIGDDEPRLSAGDILAPEGSGTVTLPVLLSKSSGGEVTVQFATSPGTAISGVDYSPSTGTLTFQPGQTITLLNLGILADALDEANETFFVDFFGAVGTSILDNQAQVTIIDDDPLPGLIVANTSVTETDAGTVDAIFSVSLSQASGREVTVNYTTAGGSAVSGVDFVAASGALTFAAGQTQQNVTVQVNGDLLAEPDETFVLGLSNAVNAGISVSPGTGTIIDNEPRLTIDDVTIDEGNSGTTNAVFNVRLAQAASTEVVVVYTANDGIGASGAQSGSDFAPASGTLTFAAGETVKAAIVPIFGDVLDEFDETFTVDLSSATNAIIGDAQGVGTIVNDDSFPVLTINPASGNEGNPGSNGRVVFSVNLTPPTVRTVTVRFQTAASGTALTNDFSNTTGTLTFQPGQSTGTITVNVIGDTTVEANETFTITLSNATNATISADTAVGTILDDEAQVFINDVTVAETNATTNAVFNVTLNKSASSNVLVSYSTVGVTASAGQDFAAVSGTLTFTPGTTSLPITVPVLGDVVQESVESFNVNLTILGNTAVAAGSKLIGSGTILDNDGMPAINISDAQVNEGNAGATAAVFNVTLTVASGVPVLVQYSTANGTAVSPSDYVAASGQITFAPGQTLAQIPVTVNGDTVGEGNETFTVNLFGATNGTISDSQGLGTIINDDTQHLIVTGADAGGGPHVRVFSAGTGQELFGFFAYSAAFGGGVRVATGDVNGDGQADIITGAGRGGGPHVRIFDGRNGAEIGSFFAFEGNFTRGIYVAAGDVNGDDRADIIVSTDGDIGEPGQNSRVRIFDGANFATIQQFDLNTTPGFVAGVRVAAGDINGDGRDDVIMSASANADSLVQARDGVSGAVLASFLAYPGFRGGVYVAGGDFDGDGRADIITGAGAGGGPHVRVFSGANLAELASFFAYSPQFGGGVRVGSTDFNGDGRADIITAAGPGGGPHVRVFSGPGLTELHGFMAYGAFGGGVFTGGSFRTQGSPLMAASGSAANTAAPLTMQQAQPLVEQAVADWAAAGLDQRLVDRLSQVEVRIADLPNGYLGIAYPRAIVLDRDAAGRGWFADSTPWLDEEYDSLVAEGLQARRANAASSGMDLLTVIAHELGHTLGLEDNHDASGLMSESLGAGVRRRVTSNEVDALFSEDWQ